MAGIRFCTVAEDWIARGSTLRRPATLANNRGHLERADVRRWMPSAVMDTVPLGRAL